MNEIFTNIQMQLKEELDEKRYEHTIGVMYTAASLAMRYGVMMHQAILAGLLHDCAKAIPNDEKLELCKKYGIIVSDVERENPSLLHAKLGAYIAREKYGAVSYTHLDVYKRQGYDALFSKGTKTCRHRHEVFRRL